MPQSAAEDAERLARLKVEEAERERRLREVLERVSLAEKRAKEAELACPGGGGRRGQVRRGGEERARDGAARAGRA